MTRQTPGRSNNGKKQRRNGASLQDIGLRLSGLGLAFLIIPSLFGALPMMKAMSPGLSFTGWLLLSAGLVVLGMAHLKKTAAPVTLANVFPVMPNPPAKSSEWNPGVFAAIEWRRFEAVCEALFAQAGFKTRSQSHGADGGVDVWLYSAHAEGPVAIAQCKHWNGGPVGVKELREFFGVMASHQLKRGIYATSSTYTEDPRQIAKANGINAMDGARLLQQIASRTPGQQQDLLAIAYEGEYWRPTCANCGIKLMDRKPAKGGAAFWGCSNYPCCKSKLPMAVSAQKTSALEIHTQ